MWIFSFTSGQVDVCVCVMLHDEEKGGFGEGNSLYSCGGWLGGPAGGMER